MRNAECGMRNRNSFVSSDTLLRISYDFLPRFAVLTEATKMAVNSSVSASNSCKRSAFTNPASTRISIQYSVSASSCEALSILLMNSATDRARVASRYCAPTDVPQRTNCFPTTSAAPDFGSDEYKRITRNANCFQRIFRSVIFCSAFLIPRSALSVQFRRDHVNASQHRHHVR